MAELETGLPPHPDSGFLGARLDPQEAALVLLPVGWEVTTSYGGGTAIAPEAIRTASHQLDLEDEAFGNPYRAGIALLPGIETIESRNESARAAALRAINALEVGERAESELEMVNQSCDWLNRQVYEQTKDELGRGKLVGLVGGDHSVPFGFLQALAEAHPEGFGVLHIDAHLDLRVAYEGFSWSHASIFHNVMERLDNVGPLVQIAIRDYSRAERAYASALGERNNIFSSYDLFRRKASGDSFSQVVEAIISSLPQQVYVSFDIDGLDPACCPGTGTPVPGGLQFEEAAYLLEALAASGRQLIGFDLCEVSSAGDGEWDANVGARLLYKLCGAMLRSQGFC
ncbi:MAG: arginase [Desulfuromonas sp.]|nr:MAG: arginase [Desulfuromonas sp.]